MKILSSKDWEKLQHYQYLILVITNRAYLVFYILVLCGMVANIPLILSIFHYFVTFYVALYLVIYYNPYLKLYAKYKFTDLDRKVIYSSGTLLLLSIVSNSLQIKHMFSNLQSRLGMHIKFPNSQDTPF
jgi:hypothetical protein